MNKVQSFGARLRLVRGDELLLQLRRRGLVVAEFQAVRAVARGQRFQPRREMLKPGERRRGLDLHESGARRVGALDLAAMAGKFARDVAHAVFGAVISTLTIGSSTMGRALASASRNALRPADWNATSFESDRWFLAVVHRDAHVLKRIAREVAGVEHRAHAFFDRRDELVRDRAALHAVDELEALAARQRLHLQEHFAELAGAAGLLVPAVPSARAAMVSRYGIEGRACRGRACTAMTSSRVRS